jgi:hypothetical protein
MMKTTTTLLLLLTFLGLTNGFMVQPPMSSKVVPSISTTALAIGPLAKLANKGDYEEKVNNLMRIKGYTREQAEKEYDAYLDNPTNYALNKGKQYGNDE